MIAMKDWVIQVFEFDKATKTGRWVTYRHRDGPKNVAEFETFGALRWFVKHHCLALVSRARGFNQHTNEHQAVAL